MEDFYRVTHDEDHVDVQTEERNEDSNDSENLEFKEMTNEIGRKIDAVYFYLFFYLFMSWIFYNAFSFTFRNALIVSLVWNSYVNFNSFHEIQESLITFLEETGISRYFFVAVADPFALDHDADQEETDSDYSDPEMIQIENEDEEEEQDEQIFEEEDQNEDDESRNFEMEEEEEDDFGIYGDFWNRETAILEYVSRLIFYFLIIYICLIFGVILMVKAPFFMDYSPSILFEIIGIFFFLFRNICFDERL